MGLREEILGNPDCAAALAKRDCDELARIASIGRQRLKHTAVGVGSILAVMDNGGAFLDALVAMGETDRNIHWSVVLLERGVLDLGVQKLQDQLGQMAAGMPTFAAGIEAFKALGYEPDTVTKEQVASIMFNPDGSVK